MIAIGDFVKQQEVKHYVNSLLEWVKINNISLPFVLPVEFHTLNNLRDIKSLLIEKGYKLRVEQEYNFEVFESEYKFTLNNNEK